MKTLYPLSLSARERGEQERWTKAQRIKDVCKDRGYAISLAHAALAWQDYSETLAAGWLTMPQEDQALFDIVKSCCEESE